MPSYPLTMPSKPGPARATCFANTIAGISRSPYTGVAQAYDWGVDLFRLHLEFPPIAETEAQEWVQFLRNLRGVVGTFYYDVAELLAGTPGSSGGASDDTVVRTFRLIESTSSWEVDEHRQYRIVIDAMEEPTG